MKPEVVFEQNAPVEVALNFTEGRIVEGRWSDRVMYSLASPAEHIMFLDMSVSQKVNLLEPKVGERFFICKRRAKVWDLWLSPEAEKARAAREVGVAVRENGRPDWGADRRIPQSPQRIPQSPQSPIPQSPQCQPSMLERQLVASITEVREKKTGAAIAPVAAAAAAPGAIARPAQTENASVHANSSAPRATKLEDALKTAVAAAFAATEYAKSIGYASMPMFTSEDLRTMANTLIIDGQKGQRQ